MSLAAGQTLSHYEILGPLGAGGMGEVYRARDTRLEREVAIKVLPEGLADDEERLRRFEREAKTLATLQHANVAAVFGIDQVADTCFIAMELVGGEDLAEHLRRGPLPLNEALDVGRQIAEGLEAAHEAGVIHRDLKPANVRITPGGVVKLLDFGLAKPIRPEAMKGGTTAAQPDSFLVTSEGMILGTPTYMSPEQARGRQVDRRTDIWAFGCVLYECLTGKRAFEGEAFGDLVAAILERDVDLRALPPATPPSVRQLIARCLVKDPRRRLRDIGEARLTLESPGGGGTVGDGARRGVSPATWIGTAVVVGLASGLSGWWLRGGDGAPVERWSKFTQLTDLAGAETGPTLSPDGGSFAYASQVDGSWNIYVQRVGGRNRTAVAADPDRDEVWPAFSPDGSLIAYNESDGDGGIWVVGATGESHRRVTDFGFNPAWSPDGEQIAFATAEVVTPYDARRSRLWSVPAAGGEPVKICEQDAFQPAWSPSGTRIAIWFQKGGQRDLATVSAGGGERLVLIEDAALDWSPTWSPDGRTLYFSSDRGGSLGLWRIAVDEATGRAEGAPELVAGGLEGSVALPSFSADGRLLAFRSETVSINPAVIPFDPDTEEAGPPRELMQRIGILRPTGVSPDGKLLALFNLGEQQEDIFLMRTDGSQLRRLTDDLARDRRPVFSPDGELLTFNSNRDGVYRGYSIRLDGSALTPLTDASIENVAFPAFQPDGEHLLAYLEFVGYVLAKPPWPVTSDTYTTLPRIELPSGDLAPSYSMWTWSPDGRLIAGELKHTSGASKGIGVHDMGSGKGRRISRDECLSRVQWLPDSRRVIYFRQPNELAIVDVETGERRSIPVDLPFPLADQSFAVAPDGTALYYGAERVESNIWVMERRRH